MTRKFKAGVPYEEALYKDLQNDVFAAEYLNAALEDDDQHVFLMALRDVVKARGGFASLAEKTGLAREQLYRTLSRSGNPRLHSLDSILGSLGMNLTINPSKENRV